MPNDSRIDELFQLPLDQFTPARNALAKELKEPSIKTLEKPSLPAWAVNQLYWRDRPLHDRLARASERLRGEHRKLLAGKSSDVPGAETSHREATREAMGRIRRLLEEAGQVQSPATLTAVQETLEALPTSDRPGRLTRPLKPLGFEALSGATIRPALRIVEKPTTASRDESEAPAGKRSLAKERQLARQREKEEQARKERQRQAEKELKAAEAAMLRAEDAVKKAEKALAEVREARDAAVSEYQRARLRAHE